jgi:hypothetical protein
VSLAQFEILKTQDGSPTLKALDLSTQESMHHSGGAWSETLYIYGTALELLNQIQKPWRVLSVGLGLAYNEMMTFAALSENQQKLQALTSFEAHTFLRESLDAWLNKEPCELSSIYDEVKTLCENQFDSKYLFTQLQEARQTQIWNILGALGKSDCGNSNPHELIYYDAYSSRSNPELWQEEFLSKFLAAYAAPQCIFATYACTGSLKRALSQQGFKLKRRAGFQGKRDSTLAIRGIESLNIVSNHIS